MALRSSLNDGVYMMFKRAVLIAIALVPGIASATYKCQNAGQIVYSDSPCGNVVSKLQKAPQPTPQDQARAKRWEHVWSAIAEQKIVVGMTADEVVRSWGQPTKINKTVDGKGSFEPWVYRRGPVASQYVYLRNGRVTSAGD